MNHDELLSEILIALAALQKQQTEAQKHNEERHNQIMNALTALTQSVNDLGTSATSLTAAVDAAVADINTLSPTDSQLVTLSQSVAAVSATLAAQSARLSGAVGVIPPSTVTPAVAPIRTPTQPVGTQPVGPEPLPPVAPSQPVSPANSPT